MNRDTGQPTWDDLAQEDPALRQALVDLLLAEALMAHVERGEAPADE